MTIISLGVYLVVFLSLFLQKLQDTFQNYHIYMRRFHSHGIYIIKGVVYHLKMIILIRCSVQGPQFISVCFCVLVVR